MSHCQRHHHSRTARGFAVILGALLAPGAYLLGTGTVGNVNPSSGCHGQTVAHHGRADLAASTTPGDQLVDHWASASADLPGRRTTDTTKGHVDNVILVDQPPPPHESHVAHRLRLPTRPEKLDMTSMCRFKRAAPLTSTPAHVVRAPGVRFLRYVRYRVFACTPEGCLKPTYRAS
jgi:hypothetical protein